MLPLTETKYNYLYSPGSSTVCSIFKHLAKESVTSVLDLDAILDYHT